MTQHTLAQEFASLLTALNGANENYVPDVVDLILRSARQYRASDIHLVPTAERLVMQWRIDGVLHSVAAFDGGLSPRIVARLKVLAGLLTYRTDVPQEGRVSAPLTGWSPAANDQLAEPTGEVRVTTFPTLFGEKAAIRLFADSDRYQLLDDLELPGDVAQTLNRLLQKTSGVILLTGPSGSGKTTTVYACLRELVKMFGGEKSLMSLEDPVEVVLPGVTQSQVRPQVGFDLANGLKSMMRQDPDVIMVGEIRDPDTAEVAFQAALTGHLVLTTFHAGSSVEAVTRLLDMGIEPYLLRSTLQAVVCQRLLRKACSDCRADTSVEKTSEIVDKVARPEAPLSLCRTCGGIRYHGRFVTAELLDPNLPEMSQAILERQDARRMEAIAQNCGVDLLRDRCQHAVDSGMTHADEVFRVLGRC